MCGLKFKVNTVFFYYEVFLKLIGHLTNNSSISLLVAYFDPNDQAHPCLIDAFLYIFLYCKVSFTLKETILNQIESKINPFHSKILNGMDLNVHECAELQHSQIQM